MSEAKYFFTYFKSIFIFIYICLIIVGIFFCFPFLGRVGDSDFIDFLLCLFYVTFKLLEKCQDWTNYLISLDLSFLFLNLASWNTKLARFIASVIVNIQRWKMYFSFRDRERILVPLKSQHRSSCFLCLHIKPASGNGKSNSYLILLSCKVTLIRTVLFQQHLWVPGTYEVILGAIALQQFVTYTYVVQFIIEPQKWIKKKMFRHQL